MKPTRYIRVRNWAKYQHYVKRNPPWIRLHNCLLDDHDFADLPDSSKYHFIGILLLASRNDNQINADPIWIRSRIVAKRKVDVDLLVSIRLLEYVETKGNFDDNASKVLATCKQSASPEERRGEKRRGETDPPTPKGNDSGLLSPDEVRNIRDEFFGYFYAAYPLHVAEKAARKAWNALEPSLEFYEMLLQTLEVHKEYWDKQGKIKGMLIPPPPNPASWLNGERWKDEIPETPFVPTPDNMFPPMKTRKQQLRDMLEHPDAYFEDNENRETLLADFRRELAEIEGNTA